MIGSIYSIAAVKTDGTLWAWGQNHTGQLGQNSATPGISSPVQIPGSWSQKTQHIGGITESGFGIMKVL